MPDPVPAAPPVPRKIALVLHARAPGGAEGVALRLAHHWLAAGHQVQLVTVARAEYTIPLASDIAEHCIEHPSPARSALRRAQAMLGTVFSLRRMLNALKPDIIVSHGDRTNVLMLLASSGLGIRRVIAEHNHPECHAIGRFWHALRRWLYPHADRIIGVSHGVVDAFPAAWRANALAIHNPVPVLERPEGVYPIPGRIVAMGRLSAQKGFDLLITAFARLATRFPQLELVIHGEGEERERLSGQISALGLAGRVSLPGYAADPVRALAQGAIFAFPSRYEGFGLALAEAMSLGLPVVAADCPSGPGEMIRHGENGMLVPVEDSDALASALTTLLDNPALATRLGDAARKISVEFCEERFLDAWDGAIKA